MLWFYIVNFFKCVFLIVNNNTITIIRNLFYFIYEYNEDRVINAIYKNT